MPILPGVVDHAQGVILDLSSSPYFIPPHEAETAGVDYLGLRAINFSMMNDLLPGINNVVSMVRPFSILAWSAWKHEEIIVEQNRTATPAVFKKFREKVETLFVWSHVDQGDFAGISGNQQQTPSGSRINFQFESFGRTVSLLDAALYGPSLKTTNGLGFVFSTDGFFKVTPVGEALAKSLDECLQRHLSKEQYRFLCSLDDSAIDKKELNKNFYNAWRVDVPSTAEQSTFASSLYRADQIGKQGIHANRSAVLKLALNVLKSADEGLTAAQIRERMATAVLITPSDEALSAVLNGATRTWQILQVRQAHRLALEALFGWVERCLIHQDAVSVAEIVELTIASMKKSEGVEINDDFVALGLEFYRCDDADVDGLFTAGIQDPARLDIFTAMTQLEEDVKTGDMESAIALRSLSLLLQCSAFTEAFRRTRSTARRVNSGQLFRLPLGYWSDVVHQYAQVSLRSFLTKVYETFIISQHLGIAASRSADQRSRMRISIEDRGLTSLLGSADKVLVPARTADRLGTALALMADCGIINADLQLRNGGESVKYWV